MCFNLFIVKVGEACDHNGQKYHKHVYNRIHSYTYRIRIVYIPHICRIHIVYVSYTSYTNRIPIVYCRYIPYTFRIHHTYTVYNRIQSYTFRIHIVYINVFLDHIAARLKVASFWRPQRFDPRKSCLDWTLGSLFSDFLGSVFVMGNSQRDILQIYIAHIIAVTPISQCFFC